MSRHIVRVHSKSAFCLWVCVHEQTKTEMNLDIVLAIWSRLDKVCLWTK